MLQMDPIRPLDPALPITPQLTKRLRNRIIRNHLKPGDSISETEIAQVYDVSRQPVREAFIKLSHQGLILIRPQRRTVVSKIAYQDVLDARFLREAIEADIVRLLAKTRDDAVIGALRDQIEQQKRVRADDPESFTRLDEQFHSMLAEAAGKAGTWGFVEGVKAQMDRVRFLSLADYPTELLVQQHTEIVDMVEARDLDRAEENARQHLRAMLDNLPSVIAANPDFFDLPDGGIAPSVNTPTLGGEYS